MRNIMVGKCIICSKELSKNKYRYCKKHSMINYSKIAHKVKDKKICPICGRNKAYTAMRCKRCFHKSLIGHKNNLGSKAWNEGLGNNVLNRRIRSTGLFKEWRKIVCNKTNGKCYICNTIPELLEAHHIISIANLIIKYNLTNIKQAKRCEELWDTNNGIPLCAKCHNATKPGQPKI